MASNSGPLVCVTGASGYVAGVLVDLLLKKGYRVRGTVRNLSDEQKVKHLKQDFPGLQLFEADLTKAGSFKAAFDGVEIIFHTASPFQTNVKDAQKELVDPALNGTIDVINTAVNVPTVRRIVLTSSVATIRRPEKEEGYVSNDSDWNTFANINNLPYPYSKVAAEQKAWELIKAHNSEHPEHPVKLVTVLPSWVLGPPFGTRVDGVSVGTVVSWLDESQVEKGVRPQLVGCVDVRDVAATHVAAAEKENAEGRYICSHEKPTPPLDIVAILKEAYPNKKFPSTVAGELNKTFGVDNSKTRKELGIQFTPLDKTVKDMAEKLIELGMVKN